MTDQELVDLLVAAAAACAVATASAASTSPEGSLQAQRLADATRLMVNAVDLAKSWA